MVNNIGMHYVRAFEYRYIGIFHRYNVCTISNNNVKHDFVITIFVVCCKIL